MAIDIDGERIWDSLMALAKIGATPKGGVRRVAFTPEDRHGRELYRQWCEEAGCTVRVDRFGNMFARRPGRDGDRPPVMVGSHLDTQVTGGRFDGALGVLAGLEMVRRLNDLSIETQLPIEIVNWTNEEGCVFRPMIGSEVFTGALSLDDALTLTDRDGRTLGAALDAIGFAGEAEVPGNLPTCYFELHIEQGPILEQRGMDVGVVTGAQGQCWYDLTIRGVEAHAGPTPMASRRDSMVGAAHIVLAFNKIGREFAGKATNGHIAVEPNSPNVIPGIVRLSGDLRHEDAATLDAMEQEMRSSVADTAKQLQLDIAVDKAVHIPPIPFHPALVDAVRQAARAMGVSHMDMVSGAGHDALNMAKVCPTTMIFVPCENGISHNESENIQPEHAAAGAAVLANAVLAAAQGDISL